jgi:hypothetical protein
MNRKQRVLTVIALIAFVMIGTCHYLDASLYTTQSALDNPGTTDYSWNWETRFAPYVRIVDPTPIKSVYQHNKLVSPALIPDVRIPWFMLGVVYVGLFFLLADRKDVRA